MPPQYDPRNGLHPEKVIELRPGLHDLDLPQAAASAPPEDEFEQYTYFNEDNEFRYLDTGDGD